MQNKKDELAELSALAHKYLRVWKWFVASIFTFLLVTCVYIKFKSPIYKVNANVLVKEDEGGSVKSSSMMKSLGFGFPGSMDVQDELYTLSSFSIMRQTIDSLGLYVQYSENKYFVKTLDRYKKHVFDLTAPVVLKEHLDTSITFKVSASEDGTVTVKASDPKELLAKIKNATLPVSIKTKYGDFVLSANARYSQGESYNYTIVFSGLDIAAEDYKKEIEIVLADKKANVLALSIENENVDKSKDLLNTLIYLYNKDAMVEKNYMASNTSSFIKSRLELIGKELEEAETAVEEFKKHNKIFDMHLESKVLLEQSTELQNKLIEVGTQVAVLQNLEGYLQQDANKYDLLPTNIGIKDETTVDAISQYNQILLKRIQILENSQTANPALLSLDKKIQAMRTSVLFSLKNVKDGLEVARKDLTSQLDIFYNRFYEAPTIEKEFIEIKRNQVIKERLVVFLMEKREENSLSLAVSAPKARVIDMAYKNNKPVAPKKLNLLAIAFVLGLIFPILVIYIKEILVTTFSSKQEVEKLTSIPVIGEICASSDKKANIVVTKDSVTSVAELFRLIRTNLQFILNRRDEKVILITSTHSGEGKSFFSLNMGMSISLTDKKVVLVGLDIRNPKLGEYIGISHSNGITNYLADEKLQLSDILIKGVVNSALDVIISGPVPPNPGELLLSDRLDKLFDELRQKYDYILVDSAPVGMVADSFSLTRLIDVTMYIMRANYTKKESVGFVETLLAQNRLKKAYLVINGTEVKKGYGYGYGYGKKQ